MYRLNLSRGTEKFLVNLKTRNRKLFARFVEALDEISRNPYSAKALVGNLKGYYSYRVGDYRIVFEIEKRQSIVYVERIEHRSGVYRGVV